MCVCVWKLNLIDANFKALRIFTVFHSKSCQQVKQRFPQQQKYNIMSSIVFTCVWSIIVKDSRYNNCPIDWMSSLCPPLWHCHYHQLLRLVTLQSKIKKKTLKTISLKDYPFIITWTWRSFDSAGVVAAAIQTFEPYHVKFNSRFLKNNNNIKVK